MPASTPMPMCPMAVSCKGVMAKPWSIATVVVPGIVFILLGLAIIAEPAILAWIMAAGFVLIGIVILMAANFIRKIGVSMQKSDRPPD